MRTRDYIAIAVALPLLAGCSGGGSGGATPGAVASTVSSGGASGATVAPQAATVTVTTPPDGAARDIEVHYTIAHPASLPVDIDVEYATDGGLAWFPATEGSGGDGKTALSTSPAGEAHRFVWASAADVRATTQREVKVRVSPRTPATGTPGTTTRFEVDGAALQAPVRLARYPYVQHVLGTSATILWRTDRPALGAVEYGDSPAFGLTATSGAAPTTKHEVQLTGLTPGSLVFYRVLADGGRLSPGERFRAAAPAGQGFKLAVFGDGGSGSTGQRRVTAQIAAFDPDVMIHTGDVVYPTGAQSDYGPKFFEPYRDILRKAPLFLSLGNHDILSDFGQAGAYIENFVLPRNNPSNSERYYSFEYGNAKLIALDTAISFILPGSAQHRWFIDELNQPRTTDWLFVFFHHSTHSTGKHGSNHVLRYVIAPLMERAGVDVVFAGHDHHYERSKPVRDFTTAGPGIVYYTTGGGGASTRPVSGNASWSAKSEEVHHFLAVEIAGRTMAVDAIREDGTSIERYTLTK